MTQYCPLEGQLVEKGGAEPPFSFVFFDLALPRGISFGVRPALS